MFKSIPCLISTVILILCGSLRAEWQDVHPLIRTIQLIEAPGIELFDSVQILYQPDEPGSVASELEWAGEELARQIAAISPTNLHVEARSSYFRGPYDRWDATIWIGRWDSLGIWFTGTNPNMFQTPPEGEEYYIVVKDETIAVTSSTLRGFNYAVTSFWQALDVTPSDHLLVPSAWIRDKPEFPRRYLSLFERFGGNSNYDCCGNQSEALADSILSMSRWALLYNKGNGFVHGGRPEEYSQEHVHNTDANNTIQAIADPDRVDGWNDLQMEWYEGIGWVSENDIGTTNWPDLTYRIQIKTEVDAIAHSDPDTLELVPTNSPIIELDNSNFSGWSGTPPSEILSDWVPEEPQGTDMIISHGIENEGEENEDDYAEFSFADISSDYRIQQNVQYQNHRDSPARQMVLRMVVRPHAQQIGIRLISGIRFFYPVDDYPWDPDFPFWIRDHETPDFDWENLDTGHEVFHDWVVQSFTSEQVDEWVTLEMLFTTYGVKGSRFYIYFAAGQEDVTLDITDIQIFEADFYDVCTQGQFNGRTDWGARIAAYDLNQNHQVVDSASFSDAPIVFRDRRTFNPTDIDDNWRIHHAKTLIPTDLFEEIEFEMDCVAVDYWITTKPPVVIDIPDHPDTVLPVLPGYVRREYRVNAAAEFVAPLQDQMESFEDKWTNVNGLLLNGYHCRENEFKYHGWMLDDQVGTHWGAEDYTNFLETMQSALPEPTKPTILWGDMYDKGHNARRFLRGNNSLNGFRGYWRDEAEENINSWEIPGLGQQSDQPFVFIDWSPKEYTDLLRRDDDWEWDVPTISEIRDSVTHEFWNGVVSSTGYPNVECVLGFGVVESEFEYDDPEYGELYRIFFESLPGILRDSRENGARFTGGFLFDWPAPESDEENAYYDMYEERDELLELFWNPDPVQLITSPFSDFYDRTSTQASIELMVYPQDLTELDISGRIDSVVLSYRINGNGNWMQSSHTHQNDSTYQFTISLPDSGGYVEYRTWAFDSVGTYGSQPYDGTKGTDPDAGDRYYFTFERRKTDPIDTPVKFYAPGIMTREHKIATNGSITVEALPGYHYATMYVSDSASIGYSSGTGNARPQFKVLGTDTSQIRFSLAAGSTHWGWIDDHIQTTFEYVTFDAGTGPFKLPKNPPTHIHEFDHVRFVTPVWVDDSVSVSGTATFKEITVTDGSLLTIEAGSDFAFTDTARLIVDEGGMLLAEGLDTLHTLFHADVDSLGWEGIQVAKEVGDTVEFAYVEIAGAKAGLLVDRSVVKLSHVAFTGSSVGILAINGATVIADSCTISAGGDGVILANLSTLDARHTGIVDNSGAGILALSRSTVYLEDCAVDSNNGDGTAGGIGLYTGSSGFLKCTTVNYNTGTGVTCFGGALVLSSVDTAQAPEINWRGNEIRENETIPQEGQLVLRGRIGLSLYNGHNWIADSTTSQELIVWDDHPTQDWWKDTYWGAVDTSAIKSRLPNYVTLSKIDSSSSSCPAFAGVASSPDSIARVFLSPHQNERSASYSTAKTQYRNIVKDQPRSDWAYAASDRLLAIDLLANNPFDSTAIYLRSIADTTSNTGLKYWLKNTVAWGWAESGDTTKAGGDLDWLINNSPTRLDRVNAKVQRQMLAVLKMEYDSTLFKADDVLACVDSARHLLERMNIWTQTTITDSVVMYAPASVEGVITVSEGGKLTIVPHPGAVNPVVSFRGDGAINVIGMNSSLPRGKLYVWGQADNVVSLEWDSSSQWGNIYSASGYANLKHAHLRGTGFVNYAESMTRPVVFMADSCTIEGFDEGLWMVGADSLSWIKHSTLRGLGGGVDYSGMGFGTGLTVLNGSQFLIENCAFETNGDVGIFGYMCGGLDVRSTTVSDNGEYGMLVWDGGVVAVECSNFETNGDTLPEIWVEDGAVDFVGARSTISDDNGMLIYSGQPSYLDFEGGENQFSLTSGNGLYIKSGDTTQSWDVTYNAWDPVLPTSGTFFDHFYPHTAAKWTLDSSLADFLTCGGSGDFIGSGSTLIEHGDSPQTNNHPGTPKKVAAEPIPLAQSSLVDPTHTCVLVKGGVNDKIKAARLHEQELDAWRMFKLVVKSGDRTQAASLGKKFAADHASSSLLPAALVQLAALSRGQTNVSGISDFLLARSRDLPREQDRFLARRLGMKAMANEGNPAEALAGLEELIDTAPTPEDSIRVLADAIGVYFFHKNEMTCSPRHNEIKTADVRALAQRVQQLARILDNTATADKNGSVAVPSEFRLYQNFPNPFNPNTEIRFDLPELAKVQLKIFNVLGQEVATLLDDIKPAGAYHILWDSNNTGGMTVASGVYIYQLKAGNFTDQKKMVLIR